MHLPKNTLSIEGRTVRVRELEQFDLVEEGSVDGNIAGAVYVDRRGQFYFAALYGADDLPTARLETRRVTAKAALKLYAENVMNESRLKLHMLEAVASFTPAAPGSRAAGRYAAGTGRRRRDKSDAAQLHLATALVEMVREVNERPSLPALAKAQRAVSALHQSLHSPEAMKRAGGLRA